MDSFISFEFKDAGSQKVAPADVRDTIERATIDVLHMDGQLDVPKNTELDMEAIIGLFEAACPTIAKIEVRSENSPVCFYRKEEGMWVARHYKHWLQMYDRICAERMETHHAKIK